MTNRGSSLVGFVGALDGVVALGITLLVVMSANHSLHAIAFKDLLGMKISVLNAALGVLFVILWQYCFTALNLYDPCCQSIAKKITSIFKGSVTMALLVSAPVIATQSRIHVFRVMATVLFCLFYYETIRVLAGDKLARWLMSRNKHRVVILGTGRRAGKAWRELRTRYHASIAMLGFVDDVNGKELPAEIASQYLGDIDELSDLLFRNVVDTLLIAMPIQSCYSLMQRAIEIAEEVGVDVIYLDDIFSTRKKVADSEDIFRRLVPRPGHELLSMVVKRVLDISVSAAGLVLLAPLFLLLALGVKLNSPGPVLFRQERYGFRRRRFQMLKLRSMVEDAEHKLAALEDSNEAVGPIFKIANDPRVTRFGGFLRSTSLDELPQLWNVLLGDMSLVGPRPMSVRDVSRFDKATQMRRFSVKPGMTGLWQVNGRSSLPFDQWLQMDFNYIDEWSLFLDLRIMARTIGAVLKRSGAM